MSLKLITDRTQSDAEYAAAHRDSGTPLKGAYNAADFNRVGSALNALSDWLYALGYGMNPRLRDNWAATDNMSYQNTVAYLGAVRALKESFVTLPTTPPLPAQFSNLMQPGGHDHANNIEKVLLDIEQAILLMIAVFPRSGNFIYAGTYYYMITG